MAVIPNHVSLKDISHVFTDGREPLSALSRVNLHVPAGQFTSIIGPSGCGKSTLLRIVGGLVRPTQGQALIAGGPPQAVQRARDIGFAFQDASLLPWRTVLGNVRLPQEVDSVHKMRPVPTAEELLDLVGLRDFMDYHPYQLSGGMQQRVAIARALALNPSLLLMDEPFGSLDEITRSAMRYELLRIWDANPGAAGPKTVLFVTHSISEAIILADRIVVLTSRPGSIRADIDVELPRPRTREMERSQPFLDYADWLRGLLEQEAA
jgi:NitT/TauT family transport system ATP-binding protein